MRINQKQINKHLEALNELHQTLLGVNHKSFGMTAFKSEHKLQAISIQAILNIGYISKIGDRRNSKYRWENFSKPEPIDARRVIEETQKIKSSGVNSVKKTSKTAIIEKVKQEKSIVEVKTKKAKKVEKKEVIIEEVTKKILWGLYSSSRIKKVI